MTLRLKVTPTAAARSAPPTQRSFARCRYSPSPFHVLRTEGEGGSRICYATDQTATEGVQESKNQGKSLASRNPVSVE